MPRIQHMVVLTFKPETTEEQIADAFAQLAELKEKIPGIDYYGGGPYSSHEGFNQGHTHGFLVTFKSVQARDQYLTHPAHEKAKRALLAIMEKGVAFDFED